MRKLFLGFIGAVALVVAASPSAAQVDFATPQTGINARGGVIMCPKTGSNPVTYVPCDSTNPLPGGAVTIADGSDVALGTTTDAACATDNGTCTVEAVLKRIAQRITTLIAGGAVTLPTTPTIAAGNGTVPAPSSESLAAIAHSTSVTSAESCRVLKASAGNLYSLRVSIAATTGYVMVFDAASAPVDGAVTTLAIPAVRVVSDGTSGWYADDFSPPMRMATGITVCFSSTGPFSKTASATAAIEGQVQ